MDNGVGVDYQFLLGRPFRLNEQDFVASAIGVANGVTIVRASTTENGEPVMRIFPASQVLDCIVCDEEIELQELRFGR